MIFYIILKKNFNLNQDSTKEILEKIPYLNEKIYKVKLEEKHLKIFTKFIKQSEKIRIIKKINLLIKNLHNLQDITKREIIFENKNSIIINKFNAYDSLIKSKNIIKLFDGVYALQKNFLELKNQFDKKFKDYFKKNGYQEANYSNLLEVDSLIENSYVHSFPNHCLFVSNVRRNNSNLSKISKTNIKNKKKIKNQLDNSQYILSPTVCYNCFETQKNQIINTNLKITSIAKCNRYEGLNYKTLERLKVYSMREFMFFGDKLFVKREIDKGLKYFIKILNHLKLKFRVSTASDPFFLQSLKNKKIFQLSNNLKYELELFLPYENKWIAVGSFNNHLNTLTSKYKISKKGGKTCFSGCIGIGYERFLYAFYSQKKKFRIKP